MAEDHSKYMPHHPKPKYVDGGHPTLKDTMLRARHEPTSHDGSGGMGAEDGNYSQGYYTPGP
jgi:hypothetical protein